MSSDVETEPLTESRVEALRAETPGVEHVLHLNNAGSSLPPQAVLDTCIDYLTTEAQIGGYETVERKSAELERVATAGAQLLNCAPTELAFATSAALAWWRSFEAVPLQAGDRVLISSTEYQSNAFAFIQAAQRGIEVEVLPTTESGEIDLDALRSMIDERVKLVAVTHIAMTNGMVQPVADIGAIVADSDAYYLLDSCQAVGQLPVDVQELQCDFLSFTGRKFMRGPRGTALLYVNADIMDDLAATTYIDGQSAQWVDAHSYQYAPNAQRFELGEVSFAAKAGFGVALDYAVRVGMDRAAERIAMLSTLLRGQLDELDGVQVRDTGQHQSGIVTFSIADTDPLALQAKLRARGVNTSVLTSALSHLDLAARGVDAVLRAGVHYFNTAEEISTFIRAIGESR